MKTIQDLVESFKNRYSPCLSAQALYNTIHFVEAYNIIKNLSRGFLDSGILPGDRVMIVSKNSPEWMLTSLGLNYAGIIDVPRSEKASDSEINYIVKHSAPKLIIVDDEKTFERLKDHKNIMSFKKISGITCFEDIKQKGKESETEIPAVYPETVASHLYTSGTTGEPKGAELSHENYTSNIMALMARKIVNDKDKATSVLPLWHVFERMVQYMLLAHGAEIFYSSIYDLKKDIKEQKPTLISVVPRILDNIYSKSILSKIRQFGFVKKSLFNASIQMSALARRKGLNPLRLFGAAPLAVMERIMFKKLREELGGRLRKVISGGGKLPLEVETFFFAAGIPVLEGYGLTETSPVIAVREIDNNEPGTVGKPLENLKVKILDPESGKELPRGKTGVVFVKGPSVMKGYYKNAYETEKVFSDGWFDTGDLGTIRKNGNLEIKGRIKNIIVLSNGENISPERIEDTLKKSPMISNTIVVGQDWKSLGALIEPDFEAIGEIIENFTGNLDDPEVIKKFKHEIREYVNPLTGFREFECISAFRLLKRPLKYGKEITETLKVKRNVVEAEFSSEIKSLQEEIK